MTQSLVATAQSLIPPELAGTIPRRVRFIATTLLVPALLLVALSALPACMVLTHVRHRDQLRKNSSQTLGEINRVWYAGRSNIPTVSYNFTVNGTSFAGDATVPLELFPALRRDWHQGSSLTVRYVPSDPSVSHPAAWEWSPGIPDIVIPFFCIPIAIIYWFLLRSQRRLAIGGIATVATVTGCSSSRRGLIVKYEFHTEDGSSFEGSGSSPDRKEAGTRICVLYLPDNPRRNSTYPYPFTAYRVLPAGEL